MLYLTNNASGTENVIRLISKSLKDLYAPLGAIAVTHQDVALEDVRWSPRILASDRVNQSRDLVKRLKTAKIGLFPFYFHVRPEGTCQAVPPPIVESFCSDHGERRYLLLDGSHRCYAALQEVSKVAALVISFTTKLRPLPCKPLLPSELSVLETQPRLKELFVDLSEPEFRPVRKLTHKGYRFPSIEDALMTMNMNESSLSPLGDPKP